MGGYVMDDLIKLLDQNLKLLENNIEGDPLYLYVESNRTHVKCPFCGTFSTKVHSTYERSFQDLPIQDKKVMVVLNNRKMFCHNQGCPRKTFAERFDFIDYKSKKTKRLEDTIREVSLNCSTISASNTLTRNIVNVSRTTISNLLKKQLQSSKKQD